MEHYDVHGIDVSHHQAQINWPRVAEQNINFTFIKASEGQDHKDTMFVTNWSSSKEAGIKRGAYHFFLPKVSSLFQAKNFIASVKLEPGDLPPVLDVEVMNVSKSALINRMHTWLDIVEKHYQIRPIIYTNLKFYNKYLAKDFDDYPIWIARYSSRLPLLKNGFKWQFWQYGDRGILDGIPAHVDFNVFNGTLEELEKLCLKNPAVISQNL